VTGVVVLFCFCSSRRRHTSLVSDWSSDVCSSDLVAQIQSHLIAHQYEGLIKKSRMRRRAKK